MRHERSQGFFRHTSECPYLIGSRPEPGDCTCGASKKTLRLLRKQEYRKNVAQSKA